MDERSSPTKLDRILECAAAAATDTLSRNLLHAYAGCLTIEEASEAVIQSLGAVPTARKAILNRLRRLGQEGIHERSLDLLAMRMLSFTSADSKVRLRIDALVAHLYPFFSVPTRKAILERWRDRGTRAAGARWLKAMSIDTVLFDFAEIVSYWRTSRDIRAAQLIAYRGEAALLTQQLPEIIEHCDEGWIVSRATLNAGAVSEDSWRAIKEKLPATYAYLCAKSGRSLSDAEALELVRRAGATWPADDQGLAIWALGQLGMWSALEKLRAMLPELHEEAMARAMRSPTGAL